MFTPPSYWLKRRQRTTPTPATVRSPGCRLTAQQLFPSSTLHQWRGFFCDCCDFMIYLSISLYSCYIVVIYLFTFKWILNLDRQSQKHVVLEHVVYALLFLVFFHKADSVPLQHFLIKESFANLHCDLVWSTQSKQWTNRGNLRLWTLQGVTINMLDSPNISWWIKSTQYMCCLKSIISQQDCIGAFVMPLFFRRSLPVTNVDDLTINSMNRRDKGTYLYLLNSTTCQIKTRSEFYAALHTKSLIRYFFEAKHWCPKE